MITQLRGVLPQGWQASLLALDSSMIGDLDSQLSRVPSDATNLVIAVGGNNVLANLDVLELRVRSPSEALLKLGQRMGVFDCHHSRGLRWPRPRCPMGGTVFFLTAHPTGCAAG